MIRRGGLYALATALLASVTLHAWSTPASAQSGLEYSVKASYLVRFAAFVTWPRNAFAAPDSPVALCVVGRDPFGAGLDRAAASQTAYGRALAVYRPATAEAARGCHIVYVGQGAAPMLQALEAQPGKLLVTDAAVAPRRGVIHFAVSEGRVRFHIDQAAATRGGLVMSSRLLNLALTVQGG